MLEKLKKKKLLESLKPPHKGGHDSMKEHDDLEEQGETPEFEAHEDEAHEDQRDEQVKKKKGKKY